MVVLAAEEFLPAFVDEGVFGAALLAGEVSEAFVALGDGVEVAEGFVAVGGVFDAAFGLRPNIMPRMLCDCGMIWLCIR